ncbi:MAG: D-alanyl-D-alanine carboxypeptidase [Rhizobiaceae bacterium]|nr:D-alanyl-D-alanine carboxypeptidase [Rhizobiaceae bacterium]
MLVLAQTQGASANPKYAAMVIDAKTGRVLFARNADAPRYPASLTKMMTLYMVFEALANGHISKSSRITISRNAAAEQPSKLGLEPGSTITVENAILALVTKSANDVATAVGEFLGGSESGFARAMTQKAHALGMRSTTFRNAHGLPNSAQRTTARDMATLGLALREHFPQYYGYFSTRSFSYAGRNYGNHNRLLGRVRGMDGIKTGYTRASGFNLVSSVESDGRSIVAVVMGGRTAASRNEHMAEIISAYMPRASRRGGGGVVVARNAIAPTRPAVASAGAIILPSVNPPTPDARPVHSIARDESTQTTTEVEVAYAPAPQPFPAARHSTAAQEAEEIAQGDIDMVETSSIPDGWVVQVASLTSEAEARAFLENTSSRAGGILSGAVPFTQQFTKDGTLYWRARYGGFSSKNAAWDACGRLKGRDIACYATEQ